MDFCYVLLRKFYFGDFRKIAVRFNLTELKIAQLVEHRHVNPEVAGSNIAPVNFSLIVHPKCI